MPSQKVFGAKSDAISQMYAEGRILGISTITVTGSDRISVPSRNYKEVFLLDFDYITLNNIDEETKGRMGKDVSEKGYKGSKMIVSIYS